MSAQFVFLVVAVAGVALGAWIALCARGEVAAAVWAWTDSGPDAKDLQPLSKLLAFAAAHTRCAPRGAEAVLRSYCDVAIETLGRAARIERLAQARDRGGRSVPSRGELRRLPMRLYWLKTRLAWSARFGCDSHVAALAVELARLDTDVRDELALAAPRRPTMVTHG